ncbi:MAG TPA: dihydrolipoyl dehydrogenase [Candidatus Bipolaricaulota bacterium]
MVVGDIAMGTDVLVIGSGVGGYVAAIRAAQLGKDVTLVEKEPTLGGICLNHGCIPSKALIHAAGVYGQLKGAAMFGIEAKSVSLNVAKLQEWKQSVVTRLTGGVAQLCEKNGVDVLRGKATLTGKKQARVESEHGVSTLDFKQAIVATGARSMDVPGFPYDGDVVIDSRQALALSQVPKTLLVIGGGYIGLELGMVYAKLGSQVTVVEMMPDLLPGTEPDLLRPVAKKLKELGVITYTNAKAKALKKGKNGANVTVETKEGEKSVDAEKILVSVGRRPNSENIGLEAADVKVDGKGFISVNLQMRTSSPTIYAIGDVVGGPLLAHKALHEGLVAAEVIAGLPSAADFQAIPAVVFTDPEIATVGMTEAQAKAAGYEPAVGKFPLTALGRALTIGDPDGFVRLVSDAKTGTVLGAQMVGHEVSNLISEVALAIELAATAEDLALTIHPHPTMSEAIMEAADVLLGQAIHVIMPKKRPQTV